MKTLEMNIYLNKRLRYLFVLAASTSYRIIFNNITIIINTNQFGLALFCIDEKALKIIDEIEVNKKHSLLNIITEECEVLNLRDFDTTFQSIIRDYLKNEFEDMKSTTKVQSDPISEKIVESKADSTMKPNVRILKIVRKTKLNKFILRSSDYEARITCFIENQNLVRDAA
jgi:hypothetical protein